MKGILRTLTLALSGLVAVTAFTFDLTPVSQPDEAQALTVSDTCPSSVKVNAEPVDSQYDAVPPGSSNRWSYIVTLSGPNVSPGYRGWSETRSASTSTQTLYSPYKEESFPISYTKREKVGQQPIWEWYKVYYEVFNYKTQWTYYKPSPWAPGSWIKKEVRVSPYYDYVWDKRLKGWQPIYGDVRYSCNATVTWGYNDKNIDVIHVEKISVTSTARLGHGPAYAFKARHNGTDNLSGTFNVKFDNGPGSMTFRFNGGKEGYPIGGTDSVDRNFNFGIGNFVPSSNIELDYARTSGSQSIGGGTFTHSRPNVPRKTVTVPDADISGAWGDRVYIIAPQLRNNISSATSNYNIKRNQMMAAYAGSYESSGLGMCRINRQEVDGGTSSSSGVVTTSDANFFDSARRVMGGTFDSQKTIAANGWAQGWPSTYFYPQNGPYPGGTSTYKRYRASFGIDILRAKGKPIKVYAGDYDPLFKNCFEMLTGKRIGSWDDGVRVYRKIDLTGNHPARINFLFKNASIPAVGGNTDNILTAVKCLPEAKRVVGVQIYDQPQGQVTNSNYQDMDNNGNWRLNRDNNVASGYRTADGFVDDGRDIRGDLWTTGVSPATSSVAPGSRRPSLSLACDYEKKSSRLAFAWTRVNPYLPPSNAPVYVGDEIIVTGASAQKVGDPSRVITGSIRLTLSGPGYSSSKSCTNPCTNISFPNVTTNGTYTIRASWGGDAGLNGSTSQASFPVYKYDTDLNFDPMLNGQNEADFTSTKPAPIKRTHLRNTSIPWIPTVPAGDMGSNTIRVEVQQLQRNGSWADYSSTITNANCLMSNNPCSSEIGARILKQGQYRIQLEYVGNNKYNPSTSPWSNTFWVYEDFKCIGINNDDGVSMPVQWWEDGQIRSEYDGNVLRSGNPMIINHPYVDGRDFTGIVRLDKIETSSYFMGTPLADGANVRLYEMPNMTTSDITRMLQGELSPQLTEHDLKPNMPVQGRYIFDNVRTYNSWPLNDGGDYQTIVRVYDVSDILDPGLKMMQEVRVYGIYYMDGIRRTGSIACADEDAPQSGYLKFNKVTVVE